MEQFDSKISSEKLEQTLLKVQRAEYKKDFVYGVTDRAERSAWQRLNDFLIDKSIVSGREKAAFFELLATLTAAGIPLNKALHVLIPHTQNLRLKRIIATLRYELEHGRMFSEALDRFPEVFQQTERAAVASSEAVGSLTPMLFNISANLDRRSEFLMRLKSASIYPAAVIVTLILGAAIILTYVVPKIKEIFAGAELNLPLTTRILLSASSWLQSGWWILVLIAIFAAIFFHVAISSDEGRFLWDFYKLRIPIFGPIWRKIIVMRFTDSLGMLLKSGLPINQALEYTARSVGNEVYRVKIFDALAKVQEGGKLSSALNDAPFLFPATVVNIIAVGEQSAALGEMSRKISDHFEREMDYTLKNLTTVLGPVLILAIGAAVAFFALAVLAPIFSLTQSI